MAACMRPWGAYDQALPLYQRALKIREKALGAEHPHTTASVTNLGSLSLSLKDYQAAEAYFQRGRSKAGVVELSLARGQPDDALKLLQNLAPTWRSTRMNRVQ